MRLHYSAIAAALIFTGLAPAAFGQISPGSLTVTNYQLVSETRATLTTSYFVYRADVVNTGPTLPALTATVTPRVAGLVTVVNGQNNLHFQSILHNTEVTSSNTFTLLLDRTQSFSFTQLVWSFNTPVANAGPNQTAAVGSTVTLNASGSTNPSGTGTLIYSWTLTTVPSGSAAALQNANSVEASFVPDVPGNYVATVTVSNGTGSDYSSTTISTTNSAPVANAGPNQTVNVGATVYLDGSKSVDFDGNPLSYSWSLLLKPAGSQAVLTNANSVSPTFVPDVVGTYIAQLVVSDGRVNSAPATVTITTVPNNTPPVANAGSNQVVTTGSIVNLDGSKSTDVDGDRLTYSWTLITIPAGSKAVLNSTTAVNPSFTADLSGTYIVQLIINDGKSDSAPATVTITTNSILAPTANAGTNQTVTYGATVTLTGSGTDPQNLPLTYSWSLISVPHGSNAGLSSKTSAVATFVADQPGTYVAQLVVNNGTLNSPASTVTITTTVSAPLANAGPNQTVAPGTTVSLDGTGSSDPQKFPLTYEWSLLTIPVGSAAALSSATSATPSFVADLSGTYVAQLIVNNGYENSAPATVTVTASSANALSLTPNPLNLTNATANLTVSIGSPAGGSGVAVTLTIFDTTVATAPASVTIPAGQTSTTVPITPVAPGSTTVFASAPSFRPGQATVNVSSASLNLSLGSTAVGLTRSVTGTVTLSGPAPSQGQIVTLSVDNPGVITIPATVMVPGGSPSVTFTITGAASGQATITASAAGYTSASASISVVPLGAIIFQSGANVPVGQSRNLGLSLATPAPAGGVTITLTSGDTTKATVTPSVFIAAGATAPATPAQITGVSFGSALVSAAAPGFTGASTTVQVAAALTFTPGTTTVAQNSGGSLTLNLSGVAPAGGLQVTLASSNTAVLTVADSITIPQNASSVAVSFNSISTGTAVITASSAIQGILSGSATVNVVAGLAVDTASVTAGVVGVPYTSAVTATGGTAPYSFSATGLPAGLSISATGQLSGTPTAAGNSNVSITVKDSSAPAPLSATVMVPIIVNPAVSITTPSLPSGTVGLPYTAAVTATGGLAPLTFSATGLPAGLSISASGQITGTPGASGTSNVSVTVTDSGSPSHSAATKSLSITISPALAISTTSLPSGTVGSVYSAQISAAGGAGTLTFSATGLPAGLTISPTGAITGTPTAAGTMTVAIKVVDSGSPQQSATANLPLTVNTTTLTITTSSLAAGTVGSAYSGQISANGGTGALTFSATGLPAGLSINSTGSISGTPTQAGSTTVAVKVVDSGSPQQTATANLSLTINPKALTITTSSLAQGTVGTAYSGQISATGGTGTLTFSATGLPAGLSINSTGTITGTPTAAGTSTVAVKVVDSGTPQQSATANLSLVIVPATLTITTNSLTAGTVGSPYSAQISATGGTGGLIFSATGLPAGLNIIASGGIAGTPSAPGTSTVTITVADSGNPQQIANANLLLTIKPVTLTITTTTLTAGVVNVPYAVQIQANGGTGALAFSATGLPAGLTISSSGAIAGTPTTAGTSPVTVTVTDSGHPQQTANVSLSLTIQPPALKITTTSLTTGTANVAYVGSVSASGGTGTLTFSATGLPAGLVTAAGGVITGTPTTPGSYTVAVKVTDSGTPQQTASANIPLIINPAPLTITTTSLPNATANSSYIAQVQTSGGTNPLSFSAPGLPAGLSISSSGAISGTPTTAGTSTVIVKVTDSSNPQQNATASLLLTVNPAVGSSGLSISNATVGQGLETPLIVTFPTPTPGPVNVTISSSNPSLAMVAAKPGDVGTGSISLSFPTAGENQFSIFVQGVANSGSVTLTASANGYSSGTSSVTLANSAFVIAGPNGIGGSFVTNENTSTTLTVSSAQLDASGNVANIQAVSGSAAVTINLTIANPNLATVSPAALTFTGGTSALTTTLSAGSTPGGTVVTAGEPTGFVTPAGLANTVAVTVQPASVIPSNATVGQNLEATAVVRLQGATTVPVMATITSDNPSALLLSTTPTGTGSASITLNMNAGFSSTPQFYVYGLANSGTATYTATVPGFGSGTGTVTLVPSGFVINGPFGLGQSFPTTTQSEPTSLDIQSAQLDASGNYIAPQSIAGGLTVNVNVTSQNTAVGTISTSPVIFTGGMSDAITQFRPLSSGSTLINVSGPSPFLAPAMGASLTAIVSTPKVAIDNGSTIGMNLEQVGTVVLGAAPSSDLTVTLSVTSGLLLLSTTGTDAGSTQIAVVVPAGQTTATYYMYGEGSSGTATVTASAPGYSTGTGVENLVPSGVVLYGIFGPGAPIIASHGVAQPVTISTVQISAATGNAAQALAGNVSAITIPLNSSNTSVGTLPSSVSIVPGSSSATVNFLPLASGTTVLSVSQPPGFVAPGQGTTVQANVN